MLRVVEQRLSVEALSHAEVSLDDLHEVTVLCQNVRMIRCQSQRVLHDYLALEKKLVLALYH